MANSNQHQALGFGARPHVGNGAGFPTGDASDVVAGPLLPGIMAMNIGDPMDILPNEARGKVEQMRLRREEPQRYTSAASRASKRCAFRSSKMSSALPNCKSRAVWWLRTRR
ncbi:hypothetical protein [Bradyrhizobium sp. 33ap4]|uniref:hypothetical protein n=1 Tax=Bradyrhizobium sp. 33ap4 TaxID=3061630 RepID=UPI002930A15F|nr:hypothetical protein [Bradyrhizobium sp. 33ap4]